MRGHADAVALKLACHDPAVHRRLVPGGQQARAVFDAVEQARVEAIGCTPHGRRGEQSLRHDRRPLPSRQVRRDHRPRRCPDRRGGRPDGARAADRPGAAAGRAQAGRALAAVHRGSRRPRPRPARTPARGPAQVRRRRPRPARIARHGRGPHQLRRGGRGRGGRSGPPQGRDRREGRGRRLRGHGEDERRGRRGVRRCRRDCRGGGRCARRRHGRRQRDGRIGDRRRALAAAPARPTSRAGPTTGRSPCASTKPCRPRNCASRRSSIGCAAISTSSSPTCRAWSRGSPTGCNGG